MCCASKTQSLSSKALILILILQLSLPIIVKLFYNHTLFDLTKFATKKMCFFLTLYCARHLLANVSMYSDLFFKTINYSSDITSEHPLF